MVVPRAAPKILPVFTSLTSVQEDPFHDSTAEVLGGPPTIIAAVFVPSPCPNCLAVFNSFTSVQAVPL